MPIKYSFVNRFRFHFLLLCMVWMWDKQVQAEDFENTFSYQGRVDYFFSGAPLVDNTNLENGSLCQYDGSQFNLPNGLLSANSKVIKAVVYVSGSLLEDGVDFPPDIRLFDPDPGLDVTKQVDKVKLEAAAMRSIAQQFSLKVPWQEQPTTITTDAKPYVSVSKDSSTPNSGNIAFFMQSFDITSLLTTTDPQKTIGDYTFQQIRGDICNGLEVLCNNPESKTCADTSAVHSNGTLSVSFLLIYQDPQLPIRSVHLFEGLEQLSNKNIRLPLTLSGPISTPAAGKLTLYAIEGDLLFSDKDDNARCGGSEYIAVQNQNIPGSYYCLQDEDNPTGNLFNGSINTISSTKSAPNCTRATQECCLGSHVCGLAGVDIDTFDISPALKAGERTIEMIVSTGQDRVGLATMILTVDLFAPILQEDSQWRMTPSYDNRLQLGESINVLFAISNTGNLYANEVQTTLTIPNIFSKEPSITFSSASPPTIVRKTINENIVLELDDFAIRPGNIEGILLKGNIACSQLGKLIQAKAAINAPGNTDPFLIDSVSYRIDGPGIESCTGIDQEGSLAQFVPGRSLRGGGCQQISLNSLLWYGLLAALLSRKRMRRNGMVLVLLLQVNCSTPPKDKNSIVPLDLPFPGSPCPNHSDMVLIQSSTLPPYCIDRFEASISSQAATVAPHQEVAKSLAWQQAQQACQAAQKRLCRQGEWTLACGGERQSLYPYGSTYQESACNVFFAQHWQALPAGFQRICVSAYGVYDLVGNVAEWLETSPQSNPTNTPKRLVAGGSYRSNNRQGTCVVVDVAEEETAIAPDIGFRCCIELPPT